MKLSVLKAIGVASFTTVMFSGLVCADDGDVLSGVLSVDELAAIAELEDSLDMIYVDEEGEDLSAEIPEPTEEGPFDLAFEGNVRSDGRLGCPWLPPFQFCGIDDQGLNDSQFFRILPLFIQPPIHFAHDLEGLDSTRNPFCSALWASSGDNDRNNGESCNTGCLYQASKCIEEESRIHLVGDICTSHKDLVEVDALAFRPTRVGWEQLWGWAQNDGLFRIRTPILEPGCSGKEPRPSVKARMVCRYRTEPTPEPNRNKFGDKVVEDMTWVKRLFYIAIDNAIFTLNPNHQNKECKARFFCVANHEIEALEYLPEQDLLVVGFHSNVPTVAAIDLDDPKNGDRCKFMPIEYRLEGSQDVEGLAYP